MPDWIVHTLSNGIGLVAAVIALYVSYRIAMLKEWFRSEMERLIKEGCASRNEFLAHVELDDSRHQNLAESMEKNEINSAKLLEAKFDTVKLQVASVGERVSHLTQLIERRTR